MLLYCIRHGQSTYNAEGRIQGQSDVPLSELGRRQSEALAEALAAALAGLPIDALYSSPLKRAMQTAEPAAEALRVEIQTDPRLMEINVGQFQDKLRSELERLHPDEMARWNSGDPDYAFPGGETRRQLMQRGREVFESILRTSHQQVVVVSHGGLLLAAIKSLLEIPAELHPFVLQNASICRLELSDGQVKLLSLNQVDHLLNVARPAAGTCKKRQKGQDLTL